MPVLGSASYYTAPLATDLVDGSVPVSCNPGPNFGFLLGVQTPVTCTATDAHNNSATSTFKVTVQFAPAGMCLDGPGHQVLQPIDLTGRSVFQRKNGSTIPTKFRVCNAQGSSIETNPVRSFELVTVSTGTAQETPNEELATTLPDASFRWSPTDRFWIYNLSTKPYAAGATYKFRINLFDGTAIEFQVGLK